MTFTICIEGGTQGVKDVSFHAAVQHRFLIASISFIIKQINAQASRRSSTINQE